MLLFSAGASSRLSDVVRYMGVRDLTFGACGAYYWNLSKYLRSKGYRPSTNYFAFGRSADAAIKRSPHKVGVFAYWHGDPHGHYIAVKWNGSQFELYNYYRDETTPVYIDSLDTEMAQTNCTRLCLITF